MGQSHVANQSPPILSTDSCRLQALADCGWGCVAVLVAPGAQPHFVLHRLVPSSHTSVPCLQVHRGVYEAAEILYQRFLPLVVEHLASRPFAKIAFTVRLVHRFIGPCLPFRRVDNLSRAQACPFSLLLTGLPSAAGTLTGWQPGHSAAAHVSEEGRDPSSGSLAHLHLWSPRSLL